MMVMVVVVAMAMTVPCCSWKMLLVLVPVRNQSMDSVRMMIYL